MPSVNKDNRVIMKYPEVGGWKKFLSFFVDQHFERILMIVFVYSVVLKRSVYYVVHPL